LNHVSMQVREPHSFTMQMQEAHSSEMSVYTCYHTLYPEQEDCYLTTVNAIHKLKCALI